MTYFCNTGVQQGRIENYVDLVKKVGLELRCLLSSVDHLIPSFPLSTHREVNFETHNFEFLNGINDLNVSGKVEMAHKVLSKDMAELVSALKLAEKYSSTTLDNEYRKYECRHPPIHSGLSPFTIFTIYRT